MIDARLRLRKMHPEPVVDGKEQLFFIIVQQVITDQIPAKAEYAFWVLGNVRILPPLNSHVFIFHNQNLRD